MSPAPVDGSEHFSTTTEDAPHTPEAPKGIVFWLALLVGWSIIAFGLLKLFGNSAQNRPAYTFSLLLGLNIVHDLLVPPVACAVGYFVSRFAPAAIRAQIGFGLFASALIVVVGFVPFRGYGRRPDNPTVLPLDYTTALLTVLGVVWATVALLIAVRQLRNRSIGSNRPRSVPFSK